MTVVLFSKLSDEDRKFITDELTKGKCRPRLDSRAHDVFPVKVLRQKVKKILGIDVKNMSRSQLCGLLFDYRSLVRGEIEKSSRVTELQRRLKLKEDEIKKLRKKKPGERVRVQSQLEKKQLKQAERLIAEKDKEIDELENEIKTLETQLRDDRDEDRAETNLARKVAKERISEINSEKEFLVESVNKLAKQIQQRDERIARLEGRLSGRGGSGRTGSALTLGAAGLAAGAGGLAAANRIRTLEREIARLQTQAKQGGTDSTIQRVRQLESELEKSRTNAAKVQAEKQALETELEKIQEGVGTTGPGNSLQDRIISGLREQLTERNKRISQLESELSQLQKEKAAAENAMREAQTQAAALQRRVEQLEAEIGRAATQAENNVSALEKRRNSIVAGIAGESQQIEQMRRKIEQQQNEIARLQKERNAEIQERERQVRALQLQVNSREQRIADLEKARQTVVQRATNVGQGINSEVDRLQKRISEIERDREQTVSRLRSEISKLEGRLAALNTDVNNKTAEIARLQSQLAREKQQLESRFNSEVAAKQREIQRLTNEVAELNQKLSKSRRNSVIAGGAAATAATATQIRSMRQEIQNKNREIEMLQKQVAARPAEIQQTQEKIRRLEAEIDRLQKANRDAASSATATAEGARVVRQLEQQVAQLKEQNAQRENAVSTSEKRLRELQQQVSKLSSEKTARETEIANLKTRLANETEQLQKQIAEKNRQFAEVQKQLSGAAGSGAQLDQVESSLKAAQRSVVDLQSKLEIKSKALANLEKSSEQIQNEFRSQIARKDSEIEQLKREIQTLNARIAADKREGAQLARAAGASNTSELISKLNEEIASLKARLAQQKRAESAEEQQVAAKEQQIKQLRAEIQALKNKDVETARQISEKDAQIRQLQSRAGNTLRINDLEKQLAAKEQQINELEQELEKVQEMRQIGASAAPTPAAVSAAGPAGSAVSPRLLELQKQINQKNSRIRELEAAAQNVSRAGETQVRVAQEQLQSLQKELAEQDRKAQQQIEVGTKRITELNAELAKAKEQLESALKRIERERETAEEQMRIKDARIRSLEEDITKLSQIKPGQVVETGVDKTIIAQKDALIADLENQLRGKEKLIAAAEAKVAELNQRIESQKQQFEKQMEEKEAEIRQFQRAASKLSELEARVETQLKTIEQRNREKQEQLKRIEEQDKELQQLRAGAEGAGKLQQTISKLEDQIKFEKARSTDLERELKRVRESTSEEINKRSREALERIQKLEAERKAAEEAAEAAAALREEEEKSVGVCVKELEVLMKEIAELTSLERSATSTIQNLTRIIDRGGLKNIRNDTVRNRISAKNKYNSEKQALKEFQQLAESSKDLGSPEDCDTVVSNLRKVRESKAKLTEISRQVQNDWEDVRGVGRVYLRMKGLTPEANRSQKYVEAADKEIVIRDVGRCDVNEDMGGDRFGPFTGVFDEKTNNQQIFDREIRETIQNISTGYRVVIFTYGQTGSGKSYTLLGSKLDKGVAQRSLDVLVDLANRGLIEKIDISARQIYKLQLYDVFKTNVLTPIKGTKPEREKIPFKLNESAKMSSGNRKPSSIQIFKAGDTAADLQKRFAEQFRKIQERRPTRQTDANPESSRSHLFVTLEITFTDQLANQINRKETQLTFVDVAGNEQFAEATGHSLEEGRAINQTLKVMIDTLTSYAEGKKTILPGQIRIMSDLVKNVIDYEQRKLMTKVIMFLNIHTFFVKEQDTAAQNVNNRICTTTADTLNIGQILMSLEKKVRPTTKKRGAV